MAVNGPADRYLAAESIETRRDETKRDKSVFTISARSVEEARGKSGKKAKRKNERRSGSGFRGD